MPWQLSWEICLIGNYSDFRLLRSKLQAAELCDDFLRLLFLRCTEVISGWRPQTQRHLCRENSLRLEKTKPRPRPAPPPARQAIIIPEFSIKISTHFFWPAALPMAPVAQPGHAKNSAKGLLPKSIDVGEKRKCRFISYLDRAHKRVRFFMEVDKVKNNPLAPLPAPSLMNLI